MLLKRNFSWLWLLFNILTGGISTLFLGSLLDVYDKDGWYTKWYYWVLGLLFGFLPAFIMLFILIIQITTKVCLKLEVPGGELYSLPYPWLLGIIIPFVGWAAFVILLFYLNLWYFIKLLQGKGEKYI